MHLLRFSFVLASALLSNSALACSPGRITQQSPDAPVAFVGAHVLPMDTATTLESHTVLVQDGQIAGIGPSQSFALPADAAAIDATGCYLMPGLTEMHAHIPHPSQGEQMLRRVLRLFLVNGITTVRGMLGHEAHLGLREALATHRELGPRLITSGPSLNGTSVESPAHAVQMVTAQKAAGFDFIKLHPGLTWDEYRAVAATAKELDIPFAGHVSIHVGLHRTFSAGQATIDHLDGYMQALTPNGSALPPSANSLFGLPLGMRADRRLIDAVARRTARAGIWNVPTQSVAENFVSPENPDDTAARREMAYMPRATIDQWRSSKSRILAGDDYDSSVAERFIRIRRELIKSLHEHGAGLLLGSDAPQVFNVPGFSVLRELEILVEAGLTPYEALRTGTVNVGVFFDAPDFLGVIKVHAAADLILLAGNPIDDLDYLSTPVGVMGRGRWLSRATIDGILSELRE